MGISNECFFTFKCNKLSEAVGRAGTTGGKRGARLQGELRLKVEPGPFPYAATYICLYNLIVFTDKYKVLL